MTTADLLKQLKGFSSRFVNDSLNFGYLFRWQGGYAAFSVSRSNLAAGIDYVLRQKEHYYTRAEVLIRLVVCA
ncbi:MAG: hypothetical protein KDD73_15580 [Anaerolineales bacterium]|nr:hypothetical protein [Anaerolineales bacterium]MCB9126957.1 hypothetical protein [Ardenticatenales bacterium]MCB9171501.1 hypothetical protein [Ardenticatenales bacterium]